MNTPGRGAYQHILDKRTESLRNSADAINNAAYNELRKVPESYFYMKVFPIIRDWLEGKGTARVGEWLNVADGITKEIVVIDDDTKEELFRCPPAMIQHEAPAIRREYGQRVITLDDILGRQELLMKAGNVRQAMEIEGQLSEVYDFSRHRNTDYLDYIRRFILMYERYELDPSIFLGDDTAEIKEALGNLFDDIGIKASTKTPEPVEDESVDISDYDF